MSDLGKARLGSGDIAPLLDHRLLHLSRVSAGPGAHLLGDVNTLLCRSEQRDQLGDVAALLLGLQGAALLRNLIVKILLPITLVIFYKNVFYKKLRLKLLKI